MKKLLKLTAVTGGVLLAAKGLDNRIEVTPYEVLSPKIPSAFDGFKILQISDYHSDTIPGLIDEIEREAPDIIVSTGDLVHDKGSYKPGIRLCERLLKIAPVFAVTGNHDVWRSDYESFDKELSKIGVKTLHNERVILEKNNEEIAISGLDDPFALSSTSIAEGVENALAALPRYNGYDILLFHRANLFDKLKHRGFDLVLAGHLHGGQFRLPNGRGIVAPKSGWGSKSPMFFPKYFGGYYHSTHTDMIVSRGLGNPMLIPRLFNRPEITVINLKHKKEN